jgi:hypothetical protein
MYKGNECAVGLIRFTCEFFWKEFGSLHGEFAIASWYVHCAGNSVLLIDFSAKA